MVTRDKSLVQAVELWFPQGDALAFGAGAYRGNDRLAYHSERMRFEYGEGLPGTVWAGGRAVLWTELTHEFARAQLAAEAGIDAALGLPLFDGDRLVAVISLLLSRRSELPSCVEVWDVAEDSEVLKLGAGYYVHCSDIERFSPMIQFARGTGLPGLTWLSGSVEIMSDVSRNNSFIRAGLAEQSGLKTGIGIPLFRGRKVVQTLTMFGAQQHAFVGGVEVYRPQRTELGAAMVFDFNGQGTPGQSMADAAGRQQAQEVLASLLPSLSQTKSAYGREVRLALPIHDRKGLKEIVVLRL